MVPKIAAERAGKERIEKRTAKTREKNTANPFRLHKFETNRLYWQASYFLMGREWASRPRRGQQPGDAPARADRGEEPGWVLMGRSGHGVGVGARPRWGQNATTAAGCRRAAWGRGHGQGVGEGDVGALRCVRGKSATLGTSAAARDAALGAVEPPRLRRELPRGKRERGGSPGA